MSKKKTEVVEETSKKEVKKSNAVIGISAFGTAIYAPGRHPRSVRKAKEEQAQK